MEEFKGWITGFQATFALQKNDFVLIFIKEDEKDQIFERRIKKHGQRIGRQIRLMFGSYIKFIKYVTEYSEDRNRISIDISGTLKVIYFTQKNRPKDAQILYLEGIRVKSRQKIRQCMKIEENLDSLKQHNQQIKKKLKLLEVRYQTQKKQIQDLRKEILRVKTKILRKNESKRDKALEEDRKMEKIEKLIDSLRVEIDQIRKNLANQQITFQREKQNFDTQNSQQSLFGKQILITIDRNNKYLEQHYAVQGNTLIKIGCYNCFQVLGRELFLPKGKSYFYLYVDHVDWGNFSVGICHQRRRNYQNSFLSPYCLAYYGRSGSVCQPGVNQTVGPRIPSKVAIIVSVDRDKNLVKWYMDGLQIGGCLLPKCLINQRIVPYIQLNYPNNRVTLNKKGENIENQPPIEIEAINPEQNIQSI